MTTSSTFNLQGLTLRNIALPALKDRLLDMLESTVLFDQCDLVVFSHLRWEFVVQRPQHIISRLAKGRKVLFVEETVSLPGGKTAGSGHGANATQGPLEALARSERGHVGHVFHPTRNITVLQPYAGVGEQAWRGAVSSMLARLNLANPILWFYSPAFVSAVADIKDRALVVYDCMDELSSFKGAPKALREQERVLLSYADLVFTGGKSIFEAKEALHKNVFCFPSSVDQKHFRKAFRVTTKIPQDIASIPGPRAGFYGVLDERLDTALLHNIAERLPYVNFVMIGPVVKISESDLPKRPNIHYLGEKEYKFLPHYLKALDVMVMPFALNEATRFISPTKTLEFMAARKPIVCTPIQDVARDYAREVYIAKSAEGFKAAIEYYLHEPALDRQQRIRRQQHVLERTSWDKTAAEMKRLLNAALQVKAEALLK